MSARQLMTMHLPIFVNFKNLVDVGEVVIQDEICNVKEDQPVILFTFPWRIKKETLETKKL